MILPGRQPPNRRTAGIVQAERAIAVALTTIINREWPQLAHLWMMIPNGNLLGGTAVQRARRGHQLKLEGLRPGAPDYFLAVPRQGFCGLFLELKASGGRATREQLVMLDALGAQGYHAVLAEGLEAAESTVRGYLE